MANVNDELLLSSPSSSSLLLPPFGKRRLSDDDEKELDIEEKKKKIKLHQQKFKKDCSQFKFENIIENLSDGECRPQIDFHSIIENLFDFVENDFAFVILSVIFGSESKFFNAVDDNELEENILDIIDVDDNIIIEDDDFLNDEYSYRYLRICSNENTDAEYNNDGKHFSSTTNTTTTNTTTTTNDNYTIADNEDGKYNGDDTFLKLKRRWLILEILQRKSCNEIEGLNNILINKIIYEIIKSIKKIFWEKMLRGDWREMRKRKRRRNDIDSRKKDKKKGNDHDNSMIWEDEKDEDEQQQQQRQRRREKKKEEEKNFSEDIIKSFEKWGLLNEEEDEKEDEENNENIINYDNNQTINDASFAYSMINETNFEEVERAVKENLITFFPSSHSKTVLFLPSASYTSYYSFFERYKHLDPKAKFFNKHLNYKVYCMYFLNQENKNKAKSDNKIDNENDQETSDNIIRNNQESSLIGVDWNRENHISIFKDYTLQSVAYNVLKVLEEQVENIIDRYEKSVMSMTGYAESIKFKIYEKKIHVEAMAIQFDEITRQLQRLQFISVIEKWKIPLPMLQQALRNSLGLLKEKKKEYDYDCRRLGIILGRLLMQILDKVGGFDNVPPADMNEALLFMIRFGSFDTFFHIITKYKEKFTVEKIKRYTLAFIKSDLSCLYSDYKIIRAFKCILEQFPWLLRTWMDRAGRTLLSLCVINLKCQDLQKLLALNIVKKHIDIECKDGRNPLFLAAAGIVGDNDDGGGGGGNDDDEERKGKIFPLILAEAGFIGNDNKLGGGSEVKKRHCWSSKVISLLTIGKANLDYINTRDESILHHLAMSNKYKDLKSILHIFDWSHRIKPLLELRRKVDNATALMIALEKGNIQMVNILMGLGASATTNFKFSQSLRSIDAIFLKVKWGSFCALTAKGIRPSIKYINIYNKKWLLKEEWLIGGMAINSHGELHRFSDWETMRKSQKFIMDNYRKRRPVIQFDEILWLELHKDTIHSAGIDSSSSDDDENDDKIIKKKKTSNSQQESQKDDEETECGEYFHGICSNKLYLNKCPICPSTLCLQENNDVSFTHPKKYRDITATTTTTIDDYSVMSIQNIDKLFNIDYDGYEPPSSSDIARFEFFIDGKWIDESLLNAE